uniref:Uncharacterized protein n=1 Tax=Serratia phage Kevin TaxID=3161161 RepID=A0AAU8KWT5_9CAUD
MFSFKMSDVYIALGVVFGAVILVTTGICYLIWA